MWRASDASSVDGLRTSEQQGPGGPFRWMVANPAHITLVPVCAGPALLEVSIADALAPEQLQTLSVLVGEVSIPVHVVWQYDGAVARGNYRLRLSAPGNP